MKRIFTFSVIINLLFILLFFESFGKGDQRHDATEPANPQGLNQEPDHAEHSRQRQSLFIVLPQSPGDIVFLGDDLIEDCPWSELLEDPRIKNRGIRGDGIADVKKRVYHVLRSNPSRIFLMIGINDLREKSDVDILNEYNDLVKHITSKAPDTKLYLQSILPTRGHARYNNTDIAYLNERIRTIAVEFGATYVDLHHIFADQDGQLHRNYSSDGFHLNGPGYLVWGNAVRDLVKTHSGTLDDQAIYGSDTGGRNSASLQMTGWVWDFKPNPNDRSGETGKVVYRITIDDEGYITRIQLVHSTVSPEIQRLYRQSVERLSFSKTSDYKPAPTSTGTITFLIQTK